MNRDTFRKLTGALVVLIILLSSTTYTVREEHTALVTRFGKLVNTADDPGLHWKLPWPIDAAREVDRRRRGFATRHSEMLTGDQRNLVLQSFVAWRVADAARYYQAVGDVEAAEDKLDGLVTNAKIGVLGRYDLSALVSTDPNERRTEEVQAAVLAEVVEAAREQYGIEIERVGFERLSLPESNTKAVFDQMRADRKKFAAEYRATGEAESQRIRSEADLEKELLLAEAREEAGRIRGQGERDAALLLAEVHERDPQLFEAMLELQTLEETITRNTMLLLLTGGNPFRIAELPELDPDAVPQDADE
ncbi:MAG: protease modulator HflC [Planctomycetota bacterium]|jgi:membrane protease subunit HflC